MPDTCSIPNIEQLAKAGPTLLVFRQDGCGFCPPFLKIAHETLKGKVKIIEAPVEQKSCGNLADKYKVTRTPTALYLDKTGKVAKRVPIAGRTWGEIKQFLSKLPNGTTVTKPKIRRNRRPKNQIVHLHAR